MEHHFRFIVPRGREAGLVGQLLALPPQPEPPRPRRPYNLDDHVFRRSFLRLFANPAQQAALAQVGAMWCDSACELGECETVMGSVFVSELRALAEDLIGVYELLMWSSQEPTRSTLSDVETRCATKAEQWAATLGALAVEMRSELEQPL